MQFRDEKRTCVVIASGPSAGCVDVEHAAGWPCITVNDGYRLNTGATALYAADFRWWRYHYEAVRATFAGELWTCDARAAREFGIKHVEYERKPGLSRKPGVVRIGGPIGNSGAQAINLAYLWGARRLVLVGFDMADQDHYFGEHPKDLRVASPWDAMRAGMSTMAADLAADRVEVVNVSPLTAIKYWPVADSLRAVLE